MTTPSRTVRSADGTGLAVYESGPADAPVVLAIHGYPDNHHVWDGVARDLAADHRVVTYDVRGAGASDKPEPVAAYRLPHLMDDLAAVLDAAGPDRPVHLVGHDWGSIQGWAAAAGRRFADRVSGYTSISGPSIDYAGAWLRRGRRHPGPALRQLAHSYYIALFQLPRLPEAAIRRGAFDRLLPHEAYRTHEDALHGLQLYRANMLGHMGRPRPEPTDVPVQLIVLEQDAFITPELAVEAARPWVADLTVQRVPAGHWAVTERPEVIAGLVRDFLR